jgi:hypothetical protein
MIRGLTGERLFLIVVFVAATLVDIPRNIRFAGVTGLALLTMVLILAGGMSLLGVAPRFGAMKPVRPFILFFVWVGVTATIHPPSGPGLQNLTVLALFVIIMLVAGGEAHRDPELASNVVGYGRALVIAASFLYVMSSAIGKFSASQFIGSRTYALAALIGLACLLAEGGLKHRSQRTMALMVVGVVGLSLSRLALALAVLMFFVARSAKRPTQRSLRRLVVSVVLGGVAMIFIVNHVPVLKERFFSGDQSIAVGGLHINASGRLNFWSATVTSWKTSPWIGHGAGSAGKLIESLFPGLGHPHNEFLRLLHDFGIVGLALWVWGIVSVLRHSWKRWHEGLLSGGDAAGGVHQAAALGLMALLLMMATDNALVYLFVMGPLGALVGASLGHRDRAADGAPAPSEPAALEVHPAELPAPPQESRDAAGVPR